MKNDILNRKDIIHLVDIFYDKIRTDSSLQPFFGEGSKIDWSKHLNVMYDFWDNVLFYEGNYEGNPMATHLTLHQSKILSKEHFIKWMKIFQDMVNQEFKGKNATKIKDRAKGIATVMQSKIFE